MMVSNTLSLQHFTLLSSCYFVLEYNTLYIILHGRPGVRSQSVRKFLMPSPSRRMPIHSDMALASRRFS